MTSTTPTTHARRVPEEATAGWQLDLEGARAYEDNLVAVAMDPWARDLVAAAAPAPGSRVLDVGCGTAIVLRHAAAAVGPDGALVGVDVNPSMLAVAREVTADLEPAPTFHEAVADDLPLGDGSVDALLCQHMLQFATDPAVTLAEMRRVLRAGGRLAIATCASLPRQPGYTVLVGVVEDHLGPDAARVLASPYAWGDLDRMREGVADAGFDAVHGRRAITPFRFPSPTAFLAAESSSSPLGDLTSTLPPDVREPLLADLGRALAVHGDDDGIVFPFETVVVTADAT